MSSSASVPEVPAQPTRLLTQNREMRAIGVWNWTLPALAARHPDGRTQVTCPGTSACTRICYASTTEPIFPCGKSQAYSQSRSYSAGVRAGGSQGPVVKSARRASSLSWPHLVAVSR